MVERWKSAGPSLRWAALPPLVLRAMAHLLHYLQPFGLAAVLRLGSQFQPWETAQEMRLSANTLRCVAACPASLPVCMSACRPL